MMHGMSPEQRREAALGIFGRLQENRNKASLSGFMDGEVIYTEPLPRRIKVARLGVSADFEREMFISRGFTNEDLQSGVTALIEHEFLNPNWPRVPFIQEPRLRYFNVSGLGRVVQSSEGQSQASNLEPLHVDALKTVAHLSMVPRQIVEMFGSYEEYLRALGKDYDPRGIDTTEFTRSQILYNGGLREFVRALELKSKGELDKLDTAKHALRGSLDERDHFTKLFDVLDRRNKQSEE